MDDGQMSMNVNSHVAFKQGHPMTDLFAAVEAEIAHADARWGRLASSHEGYGVLAEEMSELLDAIRANNLPQITKEAVQVAAVALRLARECGLSEFRLRSQK